MIVVVIRGKIKGDLDFFSLDYNDDDNDDDEVKIFIWPGDGPLFINPSIDGDLKRK